MPSGPPCPKEIPKEKPDVKAGRDTEAGFYKEVGVMTNKASKEILFAVVGLLCAWGDEWTVFCCCVTHIIPTTCIYRP